jgi:hypothetical protein
MTDALLLLAPAALLALALILRHALRAGRAARTAPAPPAPAPPPAPAGRPIIVDGSNVLYWRDNTPDLATLRAVLDHLTAQGYAPGVVFDANAGYLITGRYRHHHAMGRLIGLPEDRVMVAPRGQPADPIILAAARDLGAPILTNDRYRDWAGAHPEIRRSGTRIRGGFHDGTVRLDLPSPRRSSPRQSVPRHSAPKQPAP